MYYKLDETWYKLDSMIFMDDTKYLWSISSIHPTMVKSYLDPKQTFVIFFV